MVSYEHRSGTAGKGAIKVVQDGTLSPPSLIWLQFKPSCITGGRGCAIADQLVAPPNTLNCTQGRMWTQVESRLNYTCIHLLNSRERDLRA